MAAQLVIASIERAGDHAAIMGVVVGVVVVGGLIYGVVRLAVRARGSRTRRGRDA
jgi:ABC-type glucose/galactose transport system permease subunit